MDAPPIALSLEKSLPTHLNIPQPFQQYGGTHNFGSLAEYLLIPLPSLHGREGSPFPGSAPPCDIVNSRSVVGIKPGDFVQVSH